MKNEYLLHTLNNQPRVKQRLLLALEAITWLILTAISAAIFFYLQEVAIEMKMLMLGVLILTAGWTIWFFHFFAPKRNRLSVGYLSGLIIGILALGFTEYIMGEYVMDMQVLYAVILAATGLFLSRRTTIFALVFSILVHLLAGQRLLFDFSSQVLMSETIHVASFTIAAIMGMTASEVIRNQIHMLEYKNKNLTLIFETSQIATGGISTSTDYLQRVVQKIVHELPASICLVGLFEEEKKQLTIQAFTIQRNVNSDKMVDSFSVEIIRALYPVWNNGVTVLTPGSERWTHPAVQTLREYTQFPNTLCVAPLVEMDKLLGVLLIGEVRRWERSPFDQARINIVQTLANQLSTVLYNQKLYADLNSQINRMAVLNQVARAIGSTIEFDDLLELIYQQVQSILPADTYFVGTYDHDGHALDLHILFDNQERFPPTRVPIREDFASYVIGERTPLLIRHLDKEFENLPAKPMIIGKDHISQSWLGVPMILGSEIVGLLAIASYQAYAFNSNDVDLLNNLAQQAAIALDNAQHHAEVEERALRDSLTNVYNHGAFLKQLEHSVNEALVNQTTVSLIMLDVDYFKEYNDTYGHVIGDQVLIMTAKMIQSCLEMTNGFIGRWGGEEFAITMPGKDTQEAFSTAQNFQKGLSSIQISTEDGNLIPAPTVSQGIAMFPNHAATLDELVLIADRTLYLAKNNGRNQIQIAQ